MSSEGTGKDVSNGMVAEFKHLAKEAADKAVAEALVTIFIHSRKKPDERMKGLMHEKGVHVEEAMRLDRELMALKEQVRRLVEAQAKNKTAIQNIEANHDEEQRRISRLHEELLKMAEEYDISHGIIEKILEQRSLTHEHTPSSEPDNELVETEDDPAVLPEETTEESDFSEILGPDEEVVGVDEEVVDTPAEDESSNDDDEAIIPLEEEYVEDRPIEGSDDALFSVNGGDEGDDNNDRDPLLGLGGESDDDDSFNVDEAWSMSTPKTDEDKGPEPFPKPQPPPSQNEQGGIDFGDELDDFVDGIGDDSFQPDEAGRELAINSSKGMPPLNPASEEKLAQAEAKRLKEFRARMRADPNVNPAVIAVLDRAEKGDDLDETTVLRAQNETGVDIVDGDTGEVFEGTTGDVDTDRLKEEVGDGAAGKTLPGGTAGMTLGERMRRISEGLGEIEGGNEDPEK